MGGLIERVNSKTQKCQWKHKIRRHTFYQYKHHNQKVFDTGIFNYHLENIPSDYKITKGKNTTKARAKHILNVRNNCKLVTLPADGRAFLSVGYYLTHQIRECLVIIDAGVTTYFFINPYVKSFLQGLDDRQ